MRPATVSCAYFGNLRAARGIVELYEFRWRSGLHPPKGRVQRGWAGLSERQVLEKLEKKFGHTRTSTGHKLLPSCIRVIQGDGIDIRSLDTILTAMQEGGWAADNLAFGSGGALLQKLHRDTQKCAFKCSYALVNGQGMDVVKDPITDPGKRPGARFLCVRGSALGYRRPWKGR